MALHGDAPERRWKDLVRSCFTCAGYGAACDVEMQWERLLGNDTYKSTPVRAEVMCGLLQVSTFALLVPVVGGDSGWNRR